MNQMNLKNNTYINGLFVFGLSTTILNSTWSFNNSFLHLISIIGMIIGTVFMYKGRNQKHIEPIFSILIIFGISLLYFISYLGGGYFFSINYIDVKDQVFFSIMVFIFMIYASWAGSVFSPKNKEMYSA